MIRRFAGFVLLCIGAIFLSTQSVHSQEEQTDLNYYYRFPASLGVEFQSYTPLAGYGTQYNLFEIGGNIRIPLPDLPVLQPFVKGGMIVFDSLSLEDPLKWDSIHWFGGAGLLLTHRFTRNFEIGGDLAASFSQSYFLNLHPESGIVGAPNIVADAGLRIGLNPSYNFNIDVHPSVKYLYSFSPLDLYNGFIFSIGFSGNFRFGEDPDNPRTIIRSLKFDRTEVSSLFAAMQSYYVKNSIGSVSLTNTDRQPVHDVEIVFMQKGYMDSPTPVAVIPELKSGENRTVDLFASFNSEIFSTQGITPLTGEVIVTYVSGGRPAEQTQSVSYDLHDKTALTWDDDRKVAAFITPADGALRNYTSFVRQTCKGELVAGLSRKLQEAMQIYSALDALNCMYQADPRSPFTMVQEETMVVDSISLSRDTLTRITGDCDDLTVLYCSLLETVGIESGFITVPGHIYAVFNTGVRSRDFSQVHTDRNMTIDIDGELWVPVEITMIGRKGFYDAWYAGIEEYRQYDDEPESRGFYITAEAQKIYRPVGLKETDLGLQYGDRGEIIRQFSEGIDQLAYAALKEYRNTASENGTVKNYNRLGIMEAMYSQYKEAETSFKKALELNSKYTIARVNLSSLQYLREDFKAAADGFRLALDSIRQKEQAHSETELKILLNLSRSFYSMEEYRQAEEYYRQAEAINSEDVREFSYLAGVSSADGERASEVQQQTILFLDDTE